MNTNALLLLALAGAMNQKNQEVIDFLNAEIKTLKEIFGKKRLKFNNEQRAYLAAKFKKLNQEIARQQELLVTPETFMKWYKNLIAQKWDYSKHAKKKPGRKKTDQETVELVLRLLEENPLNGDLDISNKLKNMEIKVSAKTVGNIRRRYGIPPQPEREKTGSWDKFFTVNWEHLVAIDFKQVEINISGTEYCETYFVFFAIHLATRKAKLCGMTKHPKKEWMEQMAKNLTDPFDGFFLGKKYCVMDNDKIFCPSFKEILRNSGTKPKEICIRVPDMNAHIERFIKSYKNEALKWFIPQSEERLRKVTLEWLKYYNGERNHQGIENKIIQPGNEVGRAEGNIVKLPRLGGTLNYYHRDSA